MIYLHQFRWCFWKIDNDDAEHGDWEPYDNDLAKRIELAFKENKDHVEVDDAHYINFTDYPFKEWMKKEPFNAARARGETPIKWIAVARQLGAQLDGGHSSDEDEDSSLSEHKSSDEQDIIAKVFSVVLRSDVSRPLTFSFLRKSSLKAAGVCKSG